MKSSCTLSCPKWPAIWYLCNKLWANEIWRDLSVKCTIYANAISWNVFETSLMFVQYRMVEIVDIKGFRHKLKYKIIIKDLRVQSCLLNRSPAEWKGTPRLWSFPINSSLTNNYYLIILHNRHDIQKLNRCTCSMSRDYIMLSPCTLHPFWLHLKMSRTYNVGGECRLNNKLLASSILSSCMVIKSPIYWSRYTSS